MRTILTAVLCLLACAACATEVQYASIRPAEALSSARIADLKRGTLTKPPRIGIAPPIRGMGSFRREQRDSWSEDERGVIDRWVAAAKEKQLVRDAVYLPRFLVDATKGDADPLQEAAQAARLAGADAVLVIQSAAGSSNGGNLLSILYLTIVGAWVVPGTTIRSSAIAEGVLIGSDGETVYAFGEGLSKRSSIVPVAYLDEGAMEGRVICDALDQLGRRLMEMVGH